MFKSPVLKIVCSLVLIAVVAGCGENPTQTEIPDPPALPTLQNYQPETSYFSDNAARSVQNGTGYEMASQLVQGTVNGLFSSTQLYFPFLSQAQSVEPSYRDGVFEWTYSYTPGQVSGTAEVRLTAEPKVEADEVAWTLYLSTSGAWGPNFDNYQFMDGTTATNGTQGNWNIYPFQSEGSSPIVSFQWTREDETSYTASYDINLQQRPASFMIDYSKDEPQNTLAISSSNGEYNLEMVWNTDSGNGYIDPANQDRICWNANHENVPCQ